MNNLKVLENELKNNFDIDDYTLLKVIKWYENAIYYLLKWNKNFYLKQMWNSLSYETETKVLKNLNQWNYLLPHVVEEFDDKQAHIITEVKGNVSRNLTSSQANRLWSSLRSLHLESSKLSNFEWNSSFMELYDMFKSNILTEELERRFFTNHQISICLKTIDILDRFIDRDYESSEKTVLHWDLNSWNLLFWEYVWFLDFEKARVWNILEDISRLYSRTLNNHDELLDEFLNGYIQSWSNKKHFLLQLHYFELFNCLWDISYFLYKGHSNWYKFHEKALVNIDRILQTTKLW